MKITICGSIAFIEEMQIPEISYKEEILGMKPEIIKGDLTKIA